MKKIGLYQIILILLILLTSIFKTFSTVAECKILKSGTALKTTKSTKDLMGWELNNKNTGLKGDYSKLKPFDESTAKVEYGTMKIPAGMTISDKIISRQLDLSSGKITIERCLIKPDYVGNGMPIIGGAGSDTIIRDSEIDGSRIPPVMPDGKPRMGYPFAYSGNGIVERCYIHDSGSGIWINSINSKLSVVQGNFIHKTRFTGEAHIDGVTIRRSDGAGIIIKNNRIVCDSSKGTTGAIFIQPYQGFINNVQIEGNLLEGYGYNLILETKGSGYGKNMIVKNNRFNTFSGGWGSSTVDGGPGWHEWAENYKDNPSSPDRKGEIIPVKK